jgi:hypothetical protein
MRCDECRFYDEGICVRYPPRVFLTPPENGSIFETRWPDVAPADRCGEFAEIAPGA